MPTKQQIIDSVNLRINGRTAADSSHIGGVLIDILQLVVLMSTITKTYNNTVKQDANYVAIPELAGALVWAGHFSHNVDGVMTRFEIDSSMYQDGKLYIPNEPTLSLTINYI